MGKQWKQRQNFFSWAPKSLQMVTAAMKLKRCLLLGRKAMTNLDNVLKSRGITLPTKVCLVKAMVFPVVIYGYESWKIKKAERQRIDAFKLWCWRRLLRVPWTAITSWQIDGETVRDFTFEGSKITEGGECSHEIKKMLAPWKKSYDQPRQHIKKQKHYFAHKNLSSQSYCFSSSHVWMWELDYKAEDPRIDAFEL